jgi:hypothetical protein
VSQRLEPKVGGAFKTKYDDPDLYPVKLVSAGGVLATLLATSYMVYMPLVFIVNHQNQLNKPETGFTLQSSFLPRFIKLTT